MALNKTIKKCRVCSSARLQSVITLGNQYISNFVWQDREGIKAPLELAMCENCKLVQLKHTAIDPNILYRNYWYKSGINLTMQQALADITKKVEKLSKLQKGDIVLDIGANDGTLLRSYKTKDIKLIGFEPAKNLMEDAQKNTDLIINDFFNIRSYFRFLDKKAKVITAIAMFYDLEDPNSFVSEISSCLEADGIFVVQMAYQPLMLEQNAFDNICHEHIEYYSTSSLMYLLDRHNLEVFDVELNNINGGSFRVYIKHKGNNRIKGFAGASKRVDELLKRERKSGANTLRTYKAFAERVSNLREKTRNFIFDRIKHGKKIYAYGASTKGNTLLQYYGLDFRHIVAAAERNSLKWGLKTVGTLIPIVSEQEARKAKPDYFLVLPWHFRKEFIKREERYLQSGGEMIYPLPKLEIINNSGARDIT